ncbi:PREDICTED: activating transcription factor 7-interacting protein 2 [Elephantulus edwardii]|uniref:activating transcription factor 7-interacting protein 2 n=1 Tax=Elephantulus edwardii TaxID=28737 RepID=UPI0003F0DE7F|nr:PREDICTED: activating transcription factor 7-interacting protein 2 [Elephantulus edwardii]
MASSDGINRKILKAKKTMPPSCRKQVELLNKSKNVEALKTETNGNNEPSGNQNLSVAINSSKCRHSKSDASSLNSSKSSVCSQKNKEFFQNLIKIGDKSVDSETRLEHVNDVFVDPYQKSSKRIRSYRNLLIDETKEPKNTSENTSVSQENISRSNFYLPTGNCNEKSTYYSSNILNDKIRIPITLHAEGRGKMSYLETNSKSESRDQKQNNRLNSDSYIVPVEKTPSLLNSVSPSNYATDVLKTRESRRTCSPSISNCGSTALTWHSSLDVNSKCHNQRKKMSSENKENVKRLKTSEQNNETISVALEKQRILLEQVKLLIQQEICDINYSVFDSKLKELIERIGKTQCRTRHETIADELFAKIAKLQKRIKTIFYQSSCLESDVLPSNVAYKAENRETKNLVKSQESFNSSNGRNTSESSNLPKPSGKANEKVNLAQDHVDVVSESNDDVMFMSMERPNLTTSVTSNKTDTRKIMSRNSKEEPDREKDTMKKKPDSVIDLTKEGPFKCETESPASPPKSPSKAALNSKETTPVAQAPVRVPESFEHLPPLPQPPPPFPELVDKIRDTLPPQKPELKVKRVLKPRGIALTWNITKINPKCAPVESYHLFLCHETPNNKLIWKKIGEVKALPLPMACTLSQFLASNKYYFTVQSKDIFGRYGPFCDIKSIPGFSENLT